MKSKEEIKTQIAIKNNCETWEELLLDILTDAYPYDTADSIIDKLMDIYANQKAREMVEKFRKDFINDVTIYTLNKWLSENGLQEGGEK